MAKFHLFPSLPPELRQRIFEFALPRHRDLKFEAHFVDIKTPEFLVFTCGEGGVNPALLSVSFEARMVALRYFVDYLPAGKFRVGDVVSDERDGKKIGGNRETWEAGGKIWYCREEKSMHIVNYSDVHRMRLEVWGRLGMWRKDDNA